MCGDEFFSFREYLKRNILGYYKVFVFEQNLDFKRLPKETILVVSRLNLSQVMESPKDDQNHEIKIAVPYGGWFATPIICNWEGTGVWDLSRVGALGIDPEYLLLRLSDRNGSRLVGLRAKEVGRLAALSSGGPFHFLESLDKKIYLLEKFFRDGGSMDAKLLETLFVVLDQIKETTRFQHSKEGVRIREWLLRELLRILPKSHPRKAELERQLVELELRQTRVKADGVKV